jgi:hypothetical protein
MKTIFIAATLAATGAVAQEAATANPVLSGEVSLDFAETAAGDWGGSLGVDLDVNAGGAADIALGFDAAAGGSLTLDTWTVGTGVGGIGVAMGNDNGVFVGAEGEQTLAAPAMAESIRVSVAGADVAVGFNDWTSDVTDLSNIQAAYGMELSFAKVKAAVDYNFNSENTVIGTEVALGSIGFAEVGGTVTYDFDAENIGFEGVADAYGITTYVNGDQDEMLQNIGGKYSYDLAGAELTAGANYNLDAEELTPTVGVSFAF